MKSFLTLPGYLRFFFFALRILGVSLGIFWIGALLFGPLVPRPVGDQTRLLVTLGEASLPGLNAGAPALPAGGVIVPGSLRGTLQLDLLSGDARQVAALRQAVLPASLLFIGFAWFFFGALGKLCARIEKGEVFSEGNVRLVRSAGLTLVAYGFVGPVVAVWAMHALNLFLQGASLARFNLPAGVISYQEALVAGGFILVLCEAFRQGLKLKTENDLTV